jgi:hypothetical protein
MLVATGTCSRRTCANMTTAPRAAAVAPTSKHKAAAAQTTMACTPTRAQTAERTATVERNMVAAAAQTTVACTPTRAQTAER